MEALDKLMLLFAMIDNIIRSRISFNSELFVFRNFRILRTPGIKMPANRGVYNFLEKSIKIRNSSSMLDMGCGTGILSVLFSKYAGKITCADINPDAVECTKINALINNVRLKAVQSDLLENIKGRFDCIIFNTPNIIGNGEDSNLLVSDKKLKTFCRQAYSKILAGGVLYIIASKKNIAFWEKNLKGFSLSIIAEKRFFWQTIAVLNAVKI